MVKKKRRERKVQHWREKREIGGYAKIEFVTTPHA